MPSNTIPSTAPNNAWYDMVNSTSYRRAAVKHTVAAIERHPNCKYIKHKHLFTKCYRSLMTKDYELSTLPYNTAVITARERAASAVLNILNNFAYQELLA